jgi:AcrR family transcriptional regulator
MLAPLAQSDGASEHDAASPPVGAAAQAPRPGLDRHKKNEYSFFMPKISAARKDARRDEIMAAAVRCFARQGFQKTTIQDICAEAALSVGAIYSYFASKDAIIAALSDSGRRMTADLFRSSREAARPRDQLRALLGALERPQGVTTFRLDVRSWGEAIGDDALRESTLRSHADLVDMLTTLTGPLAADRSLKGSVLAELVAAVIAGCEVRKAVQPSADLGPLLDALVALLDPNSGGISQ